MNTLARLPIPDAQLPDGPRLAFERNLHVLGQSDTFVDRLYQANATATLLHDFAFAAVISPAQYGAALRRLRSELQADLGPIATSDGLTVFDLPPLDGVTS